MDASKQSDGLVDRRLYTAPFPAGFTTKISGPEAIGDMGGRPATGGWMEFRRGEYKDEGKNGINRHRHRRGRIAVYSGGELGFGSGKSQNIIYNNLLGCYEKKNGDHNVLGEDDILITTTYQLSWHTVIMTC